MRNLRMSRYTPTAAKEIRQWIETNLNEPLPPGDLLEVLKDGVALCKLANLVLPPPGIKFKASPMPFIQMENISHFLKACEVPPLNMPAHDRFLTVDLYEGKDPAQVLQCLGAFSRQAHAVKPNIFKTTIGPKKAGAMSPNSTGAGGVATNGAASWRQPPLPGRSPSPTKMSSALPSSGTRAMSPSLTGGSTGSQQSTGGTKSPTGPVSSWSNRSDEGLTSPAWNIHQYGYMGGASQGNQGISFGARRQITSQAPQVPSLAEKERIRKQKAEEEARLQKEREEEQQRRRDELESEERRAKVDEDARWEAETKKMREEERRRMEEQKRQWAEQERRWKEEEEVRRREDAELAAAQKSKIPPERPRVPSSGVLRGQTLSQYQKEQAAAAKGANGAADEESPEQKRVRELENQLAEAKERERLYQTEREERARRESERGSGSRPSTAQTQTQPSSTDVSEVSWTGDERDFLRSQWQKNQSHEGTLAKPSAQSAAVQPGAQQRPLPSQPPSLPTRTLPEISQPEDADEERPALPQRAQPSASASSIPSLAADSAPSSSPLGSSNRPLPTPNKEYDAYSPIQPQPNRTDRFLSSNTAPSQPAPRISSSREAGDTSLEQASLRDSRMASQQTTKAGGWASKSLLEREMERERDRQREWEANQAEIKDKPRDATEGVGVGQTWDVNQYGFTGGDSMNRGSSTGSGINFGGRRQIMGPREMKKG